MSRMIGILFSAIIGSMLFATGAQAVDLTVGSLNALHLGWGTAATTNNKCTEIMKLMATVDVLLLQETMQPSVPCAGVTGNFSYSCSPKKGASTYKEAYCLVYNNTKIKVIGYSDASSASFSRPPRAVFVQVAVSPTKKPYMWLANIHSVFGKTVGPRQNEAAAAGAYFNALITTTIGAVTVPTNGFPVVFGGDWNLPITNKAGAYTPGFTWANPLLSTVIKPLSCPRADPTSLTTKGAPSSPYDHLIVTGISLTPASSCNITTNALSGANWRKTVSDHQAIYWGVTFK